MLNSKGVSIITMVITIIIIVIIAAISTPLLSSVIDDAFTKDIKEEVANVENVLAYAKSQIMIDEFSPNPDYIITADELRTKFRDLDVNQKVMTEEEKDYIISVNEDPNISNLQKYYLMDQKKFDEELKNGFNIDNIRGDREYLVNYYDGTVLANYNGTRMSNVELGQIQRTAVVERGDITVSIYPNGNANWIKAIRDNDVVVKLEYRDELVQDVVVQYAWSDSTTQPSSFYNASLSNKQFSAPGLSGKTGSNWCLWIRMQYTEKQTGRSNIIKLVHSNPFFLDSEEPTAILSINEVK